MYMEILEIVDKVNYGVTFVKLCTKHKSRYSKFSGKLRSEKFELTKRSFESQKSIYEKVS